MGWRDEEWWGYIDTRVFVNCLCRRESCVWFGGMRCCNGDAASVSSVDRIGVRRAASSGRCRAAAEQGQDPPMRKAAVMGAPYQDRRRSVPVSWSTIRCCLLPTICRGGRLPLEQQLPRVSAKECQSSHRTPSRVVFILLPTLMMMDNPASDQR
jgi:hypothetical protein